MQAADIEKSIIKNLRRALRDWHSLKALSENPLVDLKTVYTRHASAAYSDSQTGWGLAVRDTLAAAIETLKPPDGRRLYEYRTEVLRQPDFSAQDSDSKLIGSVYMPVRQERSLAEMKDRSWRVHTILCEQYLNQRNPEWVAEQLHISKGTYYSEQKIALERLAGVIEKWEEQHDLEGLARIEKFPAGAMQNYRPFLAPPRPSHYLVGRHEFLDSLQQRLFDDRERSVFALQGLPGSGKTAIAIEIANDSRTLEFFNDGVLWVSLGRQPDILAWQIHWALTLGLPESAITQRSNHTERMQVLHAAIGMHRMLLVIDDAWRSEDALAFKIGGPYCAHLLTTRLTKVALDFSTQGVIPVQELDLINGLALLEQFAPRLRTAEPAAAAEIVSATDGLPLALVLIGCYLRRTLHGMQPRRLQEALAGLDTPAARFRLAQPEPAFPIRFSPSDAGTLSLHSAIGSSYQNVSPSAQLAWRALALFEPKPNTFSEAAALMVAGTPPAALDELVDHGVLECLGESRYTMHRVIVDFGVLQKVESGAVRRMVEYYLGFAADHAGDVHTLDIERTNLAKTLALAEKSRFELTGERGLEALRKNATGYPVAQKHESTV